jgi:hypothetical protein
MCQSQTLLLPSPRTLLIHMRRRQRRDTFFLFFLLSSSPKCSPSTLFDRGGEYHSINKKKKVAIPFQFDLETCLLSIDRREETAIGCFAYLFYYGRLGDFNTTLGAHEGGRPSSLFGYDHCFIHSLMGISMSIEVNHHTTYRIHTTLDDARVHGQHTPKAPTFRLQPIQPHPNLHEISQPKLLVVLRERHPPIIVSSTEQASHRQNRAFMKMKQARGERALIV